MGSRKDEARKLWSEGVPVKEIIERTNTLRQTIWRWTRDLPEPDNRKKLTKHTPEREILCAKARKLYEEGNSLDSVSRQIKTNRATVYDWVKDLIAKSPDRENNQGRRYKVKDDFFREPNITNSYWAGLLAGDGNIINSVVRLSLKDAELIEGFKEATEFAGKVRKYKAPQGGQMYSVAINSKQWIRDLQQFNVVPNKSHTLAPPLLKDPLNLAYLKGLYDADGCLTHTVKGYSVWKVAGTRMTCEWIKKIADNLVPEHKANINGAGQHSPTTYTFTLVGSRAIKMLKALHAIETPELSRKWPIEILEN